MCQFTLSLTIPAQDAVAKAKDAIEKNGGTFSGDASAGEFAISVPVAGNIEGNYTIADSNQMSVTITKKPFLVSCDRIKSEIEKYLQTDSRIT